MIYHINLQVANEHGHSETSYSAANLPGDDGHMFSIVNDGRTLLQVAMPPGPRKLLCENCNRIAQCHIGDHAFCWHCIEAREII